MTLWSWCKLSVLEWKLYGMFGRYNRYRRLCLERNARTTAEKLGIAQEVVNGPGINTLEAQYNDLYLEEHQSMEPTIVGPPREPETPPAEAQPGPRAPGA